MEEFYEDGVVIYRGPNGLAVYFFEPQQVGVAYSRTDFGISGFGFVVVSHWKDHGDHYHVSVGGGCV